MLIVLLAANSLAPVAKAAPAIAPAASVSAEGRHVLVVANESDPDSVRLASYYIRKRGIPQENFVEIKTEPKDHIDDATFNGSILGPIRKAAKASKNPIDYIVLCRGIPLRYHPGIGYGVDAAIAGMDLQGPLLPDDASQLNAQNVNAARNPYFGQTAPFSHAKFGMYLVTRLDGYTLQDAEALVDRSLEAKPAKGPFLFDGDSTKASGGGTGQIEAGLEHAKAVVEGHHRQAEYTALDGFTASSGPLAGYASWGSNDHRFDASAWSKLRFVPGALAETFVSYGGRTFRHVPPKPGDQTLVADLVAQGVTGVKGYCSEPYTISLCRVDVLFDRYLSGRNLAESFYAASPLARYKDIVIGDPLCRPYGG